MRRIDFSVIQTIKNLNVEDYQTLRRRVMGIEGKCSERYFSQILGLFQESIRPSCGKKFKAYDGLCIHAIVSAPNGVWKPTDENGGLTSFQVLCFL